LGRCACHRRHHQPLCAYPVDGHGAYDTFNADTFPTGSCATPRVFASEHTGFNHLPPFVLHNSWWARGGRACLSTSRLNHAHLAGHCLWRLRICSLSPACPPSPTQQPVPVSQTDSGFCWSLCSVCPSGWRWAGRRGAGPAAADLPDRAQRAFASLCLPGRCGRRGLRLLCPYYQVLAAAHSLCYDGRAEHTHYRAHTRLSSGFLVGWTQMPSMDFIYPHTPACFLP